MRTKGEHGTPEMQVECNWKLRDYNYFYFQTGKLHASTTAYIQAYLSAIHNQNVDIHVYFDCWKIAK